MAGTKKIGLVPSINGSRISLLIFDIMAIAGTQDSESVRYVATVVLERGQVTDSR
jgi:hypothetical protein